MENATSLSAACMHSLYYHGKLNQCFSDKEFPVAVLYMCNAVKIMFIILLYIILCMCVVLYIILYYIIMFYSS